MNKPVRLASECFPKVWGSPHTEPWHQNLTSANIGEIWFKASGKLPLLVKLLFTSDNLSVQVHPKDAYASRHHKSRGKTEMWHILQAEPDAQVALGLKNALSRKDFHRACLNGDIVNLLHWFPARAGDTFFVPAGTVHAIGGGLTLCEIQQFSDITYRLYDWGRSGRELHLDHGTEVAQLKTHPGPAARQTLGDFRELLTECDYFRTERLAVEGTILCPSPLRDTIYIAVRGEGTLDGVPFRQGEAWQVEAGTGAFEIASLAAVFLTTTESS